MSCSIFACPGGVEIWVATSSCSRFDPARRSTTGWRATAHACSRVGYQRHLMVCPFITIAMVEGRSDRRRTRGGAVEQRDRSERSARVGMPWIPLQPVPLHGRLHLCRGRVAKGLAERMILAADSTPDEQLYQLVVVDVLAPTAKAVEAEYMLQGPPRPPGTHRAIPNGVRPAGHQPVSLGGKCLRNRRSVGRPRR